MVLLRLLKKVLLRKKLKKSRRSLKLKVLRLLLSNYNHIGLITAYCSACIEAEAPGNACIFRGFFLFTKMKHIYSISAA
jgi:hypothetical protein